MPLSPGTELGLYEVVETTGAGGHGEAYKARDLELGRGRDGRESVAA